MSISTFLLLELASLVSALPAGGSGGSRGGSNGGSKGSSGGSSSSSGGRSSSGGSKNGSGWTSSRNNRSHSSGPLSKTAKIALAVIGGIILLVILIILFKVLRDRYKKPKEVKHSPTHEKVPSSVPSSPRSSIEGPATLSHNPGHTQAAVHPTSCPATNAELTSAVMAGEGSRAGHGESGAASGSRGGVDPLISYGISWSNETEMIKPSSQCITLPCACGHLGWLFTRLFTLIWDVFLGSRDNSPRCMHFVMYLNVNIPTEPDHRALS
ncbi:hypothetical protein OPQ81_004366 [Rhizoctonia solani]|nr:hypothetical protein OPQ81_004366 [Rhizoctonia solani]